MTTLRKYLPAIATIAVVTAYCLWCASGPANAAPVRIAPDGGALMSRTTSVDVILPRIRTWADKRWPNRIAVDGHACAATAWAGLAQNMSTNDGIEAVGMTFQWKCVYTIDPSLKGMYACSTIVHEAGHISGIMEHTNNGSVMDANGGSWYYHACRWWFTYA